MVVGRPLQESEDTCVRAVAIRAVRNRWVFKKGVGGAKWTEPGDRLDVEHGREKRVKAASRVPGLHGCPNWNREVL